MISILTGDIINSRQAETAAWLDVLRKALHKVAPKHSEIFRGDSFQLQVKPEEAFIKAVYIKSCIKTFRYLDVRIAIGIGKKGYAAKKITEANGEVFVFSGEKLEILKKEGINLAARTISPEFDKEMNLAIRLALVAMDNWTPASAAIIKLSIENNNPSQKDLAALAKKGQSSVSEALKRADFPLILEFDQEYRRKVKELIKI
ncbi:MAG TPA: hypothetical protein VNI52_11515 [Sphingobacteriaceae bacterium]|nr:hypothetical protein [Sphingobacteriaceae bacterium]